MEIRPVNRADLPAIRDLFLRSVQEEIGRAHV